MSDELKLQIRKRNLVSAFRMEYRISQDNLAQYLKISQAHLSRMERNVSPITAEVRGKIESLRSELGG